MLVDDEDAFKSISPGPESIGPTYAVLPDVMPSIRIVEPPVVLLWKYLEFSSVILPVVAKFVPSKVSAEPLVKTFEPLR